MATGTLMVASWALAALVAAASTAETRGQEARSAEEEIAAAITKFRDAYNAGDLATIASCYSESLIKLREGAPPENKAELLKRVEHAFREFQGSLEVTNDEIRASGDLAYTRGSLVLTLKPRKGGPPTVVRRRYLEIWKNEGGRWLVIRTMDNGGPE